MWQLQVGALCRRSALYLSLHKYTDALADLSQCIEYLTPILHTNTNSTHHNSTQNTRTHTEHKRRQQHQQTKTKKFRSSRIQIRAHTHRYIRNTYKHSSKRTIKNLRNTKLNTACTALRGVLASLHYKRGLLWCKLRSHRKARADFTKAIGMYMCVLLYAMCGMSFCFVCVCYVNVYF